MSRIRVAVVDDSSFVRAALTQLLGGDQRLTVVGTADCGEALLEQLDAWQPDVITLDLEMPGMGGMATLTRLMETRPTPVIILSTHSGEGAPLTIDALSRGAADFVDKQAYSLVDFASLRSVLVDKILHLAPRRTESAPAAPRAPSPKRARPGRAGAYELLVIGASTGGPAAIERVLKDLGSAVPVAIAVVQHMPAGFTGAFAERLDRALPLAVFEATSADAALLPGTVAIATAGYHLRVRRSGEHLVTALANEPTDVSHRPSVDVLYRSAMDTAGARTVAVLLTGMGADGASGMLELERAGAHTIVQDEASCVVYGMPHAAVRLHAAREILPLDAIGGRVRSLILGSGPADVSAPADPRRLVG